jgi:hypothetical protein
MIPSIYCNSAGDQLKSSKVIQDNAFNVTVFVSSDLVTCSTKGLVHNAWLA